MEDALALAFEFELEFEADFEFVLEFGSRPSKKALPGDPSGDASRAPQKEVPEDQVRLRLYHRIAWGIAIGRSSSRAPPPHTPPSPFGRLTQQLQLAALSAQCELP